MSETPNPMAALSADPAKLVVNLADTCSVIGEELNKLNAPERQKQQERRARKERKASTLNAVIQTIEAMIQELSRDDDNHAHIQGLSAIQASCQRAMAHDHEHHEHGIDHHVEHAAGLAFAMADRIRKAAQADDGPDETAERTHAGNHAARVGGRRVIKASSQFDPLRSYKTGPAIPKNQDPPFSGMEASASLSRPNEQPGTHGVHNAALHGLLEGVHRALH